MVLVLGGGVCVDGATQHTRVSTPARPRVCVRLRVGSHAHEANVQQGGRCSRASTTDSQGKPEILRDVRIPRGQTVRVGKTPKPGTKTGESATDQGGPSCIQHRLLVNDQTNEEPNNQTAADCCAADIENIPYHKYVGRG